MAMRGAYEVGAEAVDADGVEHDGGGAGDGEVEQPLGGGGEGDVEAAEAGGGDFGDVDPWVDVSGVAGMRRGR